MNRCHMCNDEGKDGGCPRCGRTPSGAITLRRLTLEMPADVIPLGYQGVAWERPLAENLPLKFREFDDRLEKVYNFFLQGKIPSFSMFIAAPPKSGKNCFAYSCMQTALVQKFSVAPMLSTADWRRLHKVSQVNPMYKLYGKYRWDTLVGMDVVFVYIDHSDDHYDDIPLLKTIMDARAVFNLPTFIISDYMLTSLVPGWNQSIYTMIHNTDPKRDYLRYPVILHRFE